MVGSVAEAGASRVVYTNPVKNYREVIDSNGTDITESHGKLKAREAHIVNAEEAVRMRRAEPEKGKHVDVQT